MATPFMLVSTFKVKQGSLENLGDFTRRVTELIQAKEPRIIAFHCFLSGDGTEMSTIHLHPDGLAEDLLRIVPLDLHVEFHGGHDGSFQEVARAPAYVQVPRTDVPPVTRSGPYTRDRHAPCTSASCTSGIVAVPAQLPTLTTARFVGRAGRLWYFRRRGRLALGVCLAGVMTT